MTTPDEIDPGDRPTEPQFVTPGPGSIPHEVPPSKLRLRLMQLLSCEPTTVTPTEQREQLRTVATAEFRDLAGDVKAAISSEFYRRRYDARLLKMLLGRYDDRAWAWVDPADDTPAATDNGALVQTFADLEADDGAMSEVLFPALAYRSRAVLAFGHRGQSKTSVCTWAARELSRVGLKVLVVGGDDPHTWRAALPRMGAFLQNVSYARAADMARPDVLEKHAPDFDWIVIDNWRTWGLATDPAFDFNGDTHAGAAAGRLVSLSDDDGPAVTVIANTGHHDQSRSKGSAALEEAVHATRTVRLDGELSIIEPAAKTREGIDRDTVTLRARLDPAGRPEAYWLESRGPGAPTPDPDGTAPPKGWGPRHAAFAGEWYATEPKPSARRLAEALKAAGLGVRDTIVRDQFKALKSASGTHRDAPGRTHVGEAAEGASVRPDPREGRRDAPAAPDASVPALPDTPGPEPGGGSTDSGGEPEAVESDSMIDAPREPDHAPADVPEFDPAAAFLRDRLGKVQERAAGAAGPVEPAPATGRCCACGEAGAIVPADDEGPLCVACDRSMRAAFAYLFETGEAVGGLASGPLAGLLHHERRPDGGITIGFGPRGLDVS